MRITKDLIASLDSEPWRWTRTNYALQRDDLVMIWVANGKSYCKPYRPFELQLPWRDRSSLWRAVCRWQDDMPLAGYKQPEVDNAD